MTFHNYLAYRAPSVGKWELRHGLLRSCGPQTFQLFLRTKLTRRDLILPRSVKPVWLQMPHLQVTNDGPEQARNCPASSR